MGPYVGGRGDVAKPQNRALCVDLLAAQRPLALAHHWVAPLGFILRPGIFGAVLGLPDQTYSEAPRSVGPHWLSKALKCPWGTY